MARVHESSRSGDVSVTTSRSAQDRTTNITSQRADIQALNDASRRDTDRLPANQADGQINWLGSSFSGSDIKVVAHLYKAADFTEELKNLKDTKDLYKAIEDGAFNLLGSMSGLVVAFHDAYPSHLISYDMRRKAFESALGLNPEDPVNQKAISFLTSQVFKTGIFTVNNINILRKITQDINTKYKRQGDEIASRIRELELIKGDAQATVNLGSLQTLSIQSHREKYGVRALGHSYVKGYTRGPRTIAGSMIFTVFDEHSLLKLIRAMGARESIWKDPEIATLLPDQLPPLDVTIAFANEYGALSEMRIFGLEFVNDGMTMSIEDLLTEQIINFVARDCDVMTKAGMVRLSRLQRGSTDISRRDLSASSLSFNNDRYMRYIDKIGVRRRLLNR